MSARPPVPKLLLLLALSLCAWIGIHAVRSRSDSVVQPAWNAAATQGKPDQVVAYYFHVTARCSTCRMIQAYTEEALASGFGIALANRDLEFRPVNIQQPENRHFVRDYRLYTRSVVIVRFHNGRQAEWENLPEVWYLLDDKSTFISYVQRHVRGLLDKL